MCESILSEPLSTHFEAEPGTHPMSACFQHLTHDGKKKGSFKLYRGPDLYFRCGCDGLRFATRDAVIDHIGVWQHEHSASHPVQNQSEPMWLREKGKI